MENILEIKDLTIQYHADRRVVEAVNNLSLTLKKGESLGLVGETGAGKTTTALGIMGLIPNPPGMITEGEIVFEGQDLLKLNKKKMREVRGKKISMIFQDPMTSLNPVMTVGDQIAESIRIHEKCSKAEAAKKAVEMLENTDKSILDISELCGFGSVAYFIKLFKESMGITPHKYRIP